MILLLSHLFSLKLFVPVIVVSSVIVLCHQVLIHSSTQWITRMLRVLMWMNTAEKIFPKTFGFYVCFDHNIFFNNVLIIINMDSRNHSPCQYFNLDFNMQIQKAWSVPGRARQSRAGVSSSSRIRAGPPARAGAAIPSGRQQSRCWLLFGCCCRSLRCRSRVASSRKRCPARQDERVQTAHASWP